MEKGRKREYCELLGIPVDADEELIKKAYRKLALEYHPDRPNNKHKKEEAELMFKKLTEAYEGLQNNNSTLNILKSCFRSQEIHSSLEQFFFSTGSSSNFNLSSVSCSDFCSVGAVFSSNSASNIKTNKSPRRGQSLQTILKISFNESLTGCTKTIEFNRSMICNTCEGLGCSKNSVPQTCRDCGGKGTLTAQITGGGNITTPCPSCHSSGTFISKDCNVCKGSGRIQSKKTCTIEVPPGVATGSKQIFEGDGDEGEEGGPPGDLIVCFEVETHPFYERHGYDIYCKICVSFPQAVLGTTLEIPSVYGHILKVPVEPGIQHNQMIKINEEGILNSEKKRGDLYLQIIIEIPKNITEEEKNLLKKLASKKNFKSNFICT